MLIFGKDDDDDETGRKERGRDNVLVDRTLDVRLERCVYTQYGW